MNDKPKSLDDLQKDAADALRRASRTDGPDYTDALREASETIVEARSRFFTADGLPDWKGAGWAYRQWMKEASFQASIPRDLLPRIQNALRYHVSAALRARLTPEEIVELGLRVESARERGAEKRELAGETLSLFSPAGPPLVDVEDLVRLFDRLTRVLGRADLDALASAPAAQRRALTTSISAATDKIDTITAGIAARRR